MERYVGAEAINVGVAMVRTEHRDDYLSILRERMKIEPSIKEEGLLFAR